MSCRQLKVISNYCNSFYLIDLWMYNCTPISWTWKIVVIFFPNMFQFKGTSYTRMRVLSRHNQWRFISSWHLDLQLAILARPPKSSRGWNGLYTVPADHQAFGIECAPCSRLFAGCFIYGFVGCFSCHSHRVSLYQLVIMLASSYRFGSLVAYLV